MTNLEKIKSMTAEELADFILLNTSHCFQDKCDKCNFKCNSSECFFTWNYNGILEYLNEDY